MNQFDFRKHVKVILTLSILIITLSGIFIYTWYGKWFECKSIVESGGRKYYFYSYTEGHIGPSSYRYIAVALHPMRNAKDQPLYVFSDAVTRIWYKKNLKDGREVLSIYEEGELLVHDVQGDGIELKMLRDEPTSSLDSISLCSE